MDELPPFELGYPPWNEAVARCSLTAPAASPAARRDAGA
jgi:hypothetical protein